MKKLFALLFVVIATTTLVSCEGEQGPPGESIYMVSELHSISRSEWKYSNDGFYYCDITPDFSSRWSGQEKLDFYDNGLLMVYMIDGYETEGEIQQPLPTVINWTNAEGETEMNNFSFDFVPGEIRLYFTYSGSEAYPAAPEILHFRIVAYW